MLCWEVGTLCTEIMEHLRLKNDMELSPISTVKTITVYSAAAIFALFMASMMAHTKFHFSNT